MRSLIRRWVARGISRSSGIHRGIAPGIAVAAAVLAVAAMGCSGDAGGGSSGAGGAGARGGSIGSGGGGAGGAGGAGGESPAGGNSGAGTGGGVAGAPGGAGGESPAGIGGGIAPGAGGGGNRAVGGEAGGSGGGGGRAAGGSAGGLGTGGRAGAGGAGGAGAPGPSCDDGNPCTHDGIAEGACRHVALADGASCDDGDLCTQADRCAAGRCVSGARATGPLAILGAVQSFGTGLAIATSGDRFFFVDRPDLGRVMHLTLAKVSSEALAATASLDLDLGFSTPLATAWDDLQAVTDGDTSFIIGSGQARSVHFFSTTAAGDLRPRGVLPIGDLAVPALTAMTGRGHNLWICTNFGFFGAPSGTVVWIDVSDPDAPKILATGVPGGVCGSVAASEDGARLYVNTTTGVRWANLGAGPADDGTFAFEPDAIIARDSALSVRGQRLLTRSTERLGLFDEVTHAVLASFDVPGAHAAALTDAGVFVESDRAVDGRTSYVVGLYDFTGKLLAERAVDRLGYVNDITQARSTVGARYAMDTLSRQLFRVTGDGFAPREAIGVGSLRNVYASGSHVLARSSVSAHLIDATNPYAPFIVAGGPHRAPDLGLMLDESLDPPRLLPEIDGASSLYGPSWPGAATVLARRGHAATTTITRVTSDRAAHHVVGTSFDLPGGTANLLTAGEYLYRAALEGDHLRFQRWLLAELRQGRTVPSSDVTLPAPAGAVDSTSDGSPVIFGVDARARRAVIATAGVPGALQLVDLSVEPPALLDTQPLPPLDLGSDVIPNPVLGVGVRGERMVYTTLGSVVFRDRGSPVESVLEPRGLVTSLLDFDGSVAYVGTSNDLEVVARPTPGQTPLVVDALPTRSPASSLGETDYALVVGSSTEMLTLHPSCP